jgi:hypothetical protein
MLVKVGFEKGSLRCTRRGTCSSCGRRTSRVFKVWQTLNPFNRVRSRSAQPTAQLRGRAWEPSQGSHDDKNEDGVPKSREEINAELRADLRIKTSAPLLCVGCEKIGIMAARTIRGPIAGSA